MLYDIFLRDKDGKVQSFVAAGGQDHDTNPVPRPREGEGGLPKHQGLYTAAPMGRGGDPGGSLRHQAPPIWKGDLRLESSLWGEGEVLRGSHEGILTPPAPQLLPEALALSQGLMNMPPGGAGFQGPWQYSATHVALPPPPEVKEMLEEAGRLPDFWEGVELGTRPPPACSKHRGCSGCRNATEQLSPRDRKAAARLEAGVKVEKGVVQVHYPYLAERQQRPGPGHPEQRGEEPDSQGTA